MMNAPENSQPPAVPKPESSESQPTPQSAQPPQVQPAAPVTLTTPSAPQPPETPKIPLQNIIEEPMDRRDFIKWYTIGWTCFAAVIGGYATMVLRYLFPNVLFEPVQTFRAGYPDEYQVGEVSERWKDKYAVWLVRDAEKIYVLSTVCTHLGCTPNWLANDNKFKCPCHGSGFYKTGVNFEGPAPRPLERFRIVLMDSGEILVDKTKKYQAEKGEWKDPESFISV